MGLQNVCSQNLVLFLKGATKPLSKSKTPRYTNAVVQLIMLCGKSFLKEKTSDDTTFDQTFSDFLAQLGMCF